MSSFDHLKHLARAAVSSLLPVTPPTPNHFFTPQDIGRLHDLDGANPASIDAQTWDDLLLESFEDKLAPDASIFGRQMLHRRLRACAPA